MSPSIRRSAAALTAVAMLAPAAGSLTQARAATTASSLKLKGAYAFVDNSLGDHKSYATVVFKTANQLPRRSDGMIRASGSYGGGGSSIGSVGGKASKCYVFYEQIRDGKITTSSNGKVSGKTGTSHLLTVEARGTNGDLKATMHVTLRHKSDGDRTGKALDC